MQGERRSFKFDWITIILFLLLVGFGYVNILSASSSGEVTSYFDFTTSYGKQLIFIFFTIGLIILILSVEAKFYERFASIIYLSNTQELASRSANTIWRTTLTLGILGLDLVGDIQNEVHRATNSQKANGWHNQISDGGELTARYSVARQTRWRIDNPNLELKQQYKHLSAI